MLHIPFSPAAPRALPARTESPCKHDTYPSPTSPDHARWIRRAQRVVRDAALAHDVVQDVQIRLWRLGQPPAAACALVPRVLRQHSLFLLRGERRRRHHETCVENTRREASAADDPERLVLRGELRAAIDAAIMRLPGEFRAACVLRFEHELEYAEIAERLRVPLGTVRSRLARARQLLQRDLAAWIADECIDCAARASGTSSGRAAFVSCRPHAAAAVAPGARLAHAQSET
jgi:RNA polymerase sigma-70 factor (ECF subfamily)